MNKFEENPPSALEAAKHRPKCMCIECLKKRAAKLLDKTRPKVSHPDTRLLGGNPNEVVEKAIEKSSNAKAAKSVRISKQNRKDCRQYVQSELASKLRYLRGARQAGEIAAKVGMSRESIYRIERGSPVKLSSVKAIANVMGASRAEFLDLIAAWLRQVAGEDSHDLQIAVKKPKPLDYDFYLEHQAEQVRKLLGGLTITERDHLIVALQSRQIMKCIGFMTALVNIPIGITAKN